MTDMTPDLVQAIQQAGGEPLRMVDPTTQETYVLVRETIYQRVKGLLEDDPDSLYPLLADLSPEDWEDRALYLPPKP